MHTTNIIQKLFVTQKNRDIAAIVRQQYQAEIDVSWEENAPFSDMTVVVGCDRENCRFTFNSYRTVDPILEMIVERWLHILPLILHTSKRSISPLGFTLNLNDAGLDPGVSFCDSRPEFTLVPDSIFVGSSGYEGIKNHFATVNIPWSDRSGTVFWRGSTTGRQEGSVLDLPRVKLVCMCRSRNDKLYDVGVTNIVDRSDSDREILRNIDIMSDFVPWKSLNQYRYHIDIDGHSNSWPGLMFKLLSGGLVFKVESPHGFRQWYYHLLKPWENYIPVRSDLTDLFKVVDFCRSNDALAREIALQGRRLAYSMTMDSELDVGRRSIEAHCARERMASS